MVERKTVVNLWFIKHSNGLFHYGLDYAEALAGSVRELWVRDATLGTLVARRLPGVPVRVLGVGAMLRAAARAALRGDALFTPSSHPLPFMPRQTVVVHDSFPFEGRAGRMKRLLFKLGMTTSRGTAGYINRSDALAFLQSCGVPSRRCRYLPNRIGDPQVRSADPVLIGERMAVGLFGSDSPKKNYDALFQQVEAAGMTDDVTWAIFGHANAYTERVEREHPSLAIEVVASDTCEITAFIDRIDVAVSVAEGEGFARPIALALMRGVPTLLLDTPVFREFYQGSASLYPTVAALVSGLADLSPDSRLDRPMLAIERTLRADYTAALSFLRSGRSAAVDIR